MHSAGGRRAGERADGRTGARRVPQGYRHQLRARERPPEFLGIGDRVGTVAAGKTADLLIVKGVPDRRIEDIRSVAYVFKDDAAYDPAKLRAAAKGQLGQH